MVTSTSLISDTNPAANQQPAVTASVHAGRGTAAASRESLPPHRTSSQSLPAALARSQQMDAGAASPSHIVLPTYWQASHSGDASSSQSPRPHSPSYSSPQRPLNSSLPDILHSHLGPSLRQNQHRHNRDRQQQQQRPRSHGDGAASSVARAAQQQQHGGRHRPRAGEDRSNRRTRTLSTSSTQTQEGGSCKEPCVKCVVTVTSFRWVLVLLSVLGVCCVVSGIILAALHAVGNSFLFLAIMFIGLGILLVLVVAVGWKCTPRGHEPLHALFRIGQFHNRRPRERRHRRHRNRDGNWFGGVLYPEFQYRRPPPSYSASMQDYNNQSLQELRTSGALSAGNIDSGSLPSSPPPSYRSRTSTIHSGITSTFPGGQSGELPNSRPPTYRSRAPSRRPSLPREEGREVDPSTDEALADVAFTEPLAGEGNSNAPSDGNVFIVSSSSPSADALVTSSSSPPSPTSQVPLQSHVVNIDSVQASSSEQTQAMESYTTPSHGSATDMTSDSANIQISQAVVSPSSSLHPSSSSPLPSSEQAPNLHQRMESQDREMLEQALQSLDNRIHAEEDGGHVNHGASFNEPENFDTHL